MTGPTPRDTDPLRPTGPAYDDPIRAYRAGFRAGLGLRPTKLGLLCLGIALGLIAGILIGRSTLAATSRAASEPAEVPSKPSQQVIPVTAQSRLGGPPRALGGSPTAGASLAPSPRPKPTVGIGEPACYPAPCRTPAPTLSSIVVSGLASTYGEGYDGWIAWPAGPGWKLLVCGSARCVTVTSNDAGPDLAMQREGRVIDLNAQVFNAVCGCNWRLVGLAPVHVTVLRAPR